jgi:hypothetical protein
MAKTEHNTTRKTTKRRLSPKQKAFKKVFAGLVQEMMNRAGNDALDIVYGPGGKAMSRKKVENRIREQNKRRIQRAQRAMAAKA